MTWPTDCPKCRNTTSGICRCLNDDDGPVIMFMPPRFVHRTCNACLAPAAGELRVGRRSTCHVFGTAIALCQDCVDAVCKTLSEATASLTGRKRDATLPERDRAREWAARWKRLGKRLARWKWDEQVGIWPWTPRK